MRSQQKVQYGHNSKRGHIALKILTVTIIIRLNMAVTSKCGRVTLKILWHSIFFTETLVIPGLSTS